MERKRIARLQPITNEGSSLSILEQVEAFCKGGARWVQLRIKKPDEKGFHEIALRAREITERNDCALILDDRVEMVKEVEADGVHLGEKDMNPDKARNILGQKALIGGTADRSERVEELAPLTDYIGCGPFRNTRTKKALSPILGLEGYRQIMEGIKEKGIRTPILAIGGIQKSDISELLRIGVFGIAVSSNITEAKDPVRRTADLLEALEKGRSS